MSREDGVHTSIGPCWCGSGCHHGGYHMDPSDLRYDDAERRAFCVRTGAWVPGGYVHSVKGQLRKTVGQRRGFQHRYDEAKTTTRGKKAYRWVDLRDGRRVQIAVESNPGYRTSRSSSKADDASKTRRDRLYQREQAPAPTRSRRGVVKATTTRARKFLGLGKRDAHGNLHDPATGRFTKKG